LAYFEAEWVNQKINIRFGTSTETGNLGFAIYQETVDGRIQERSEFIKSKNIDSLQLSDYQKSFSSNNDLPIWMTDTDTNGKITIHGPFTIGKKYGFEQKQEKIDWTSINEKITTEKQGNLVYVNKVDVLVNKTGMYRISHQQLLDMGLDLTGQDSKNIALELKTTNGNIAIARKIAGEVFNSNSYIEFYGLENKGFYTDNNVYQISVNPNAISNNCWLIQMPD